MIPKSSVIPNPIYHRHVGDYFKRASFTNGVRVYVDLASSRERAHLFAENIFTVLFYQCRWMVTS